VTPASDPVAQPTPKRPVRPSDRPDWPYAGMVAECAVLGAACLLTFWLVTHLLSRVHSLSRHDNLLGGMWAVLATIFVLRDSLSQSLAAAVSRVSATSVSFVLCLIYLIFLPFHAWALAVLIGASALVAMLLARSGDAVTAGITTAVLMVVAAITSQHAWQQPILRLADTIVGVAVGALAAWASTRVKRLWPTRPEPPARA
jgi:fusaric acid resistance family protein